jgi:uncharacterized protein YdhG (YjbR/CyaY superfamily)
MATTTTTKSPAKKSKTETFSAEEKEAMRAAAKEAKKQGGRAEGLAALRAAIDAMPQPDKGLAETIHKIVTDVAPSLQPKTWYGMPAWADENGKAVCFFTPAVKFKARYASFGFNESAKLDDGNMWVTSFAVLKLGDAEQKKLAAMVKKAIG